MFNYGFPAGGGNRSNTSYIGSYQHALAIEAEGVHRARQAAEQGYAQGYDEGYYQGWENAVNIANENMRGQLAYTRQHFEEKELLKTELARQDKVIDAFKARVMTMEEENQRLRQNIENIDRSYKEVTQKYAEICWQYNRAMVFVSTVGVVLEELTRDKSPKARHVRKLFAERYAQEVNKRLKWGTIKMAPDVDPVFGQVLPETRKFIVDLLVMAQEDKASSLTSEM